MLQSQIFAQQSQQQYYLSYTFERNKEEFPNKLDISEYVDEQEHYFVIGYRKLITLLEKDGADFDENFLKLFSDKQKGWVQISNQKPLEINNFNQKSQIWILLQKKRFVKKEKKIQEEKDKKILKIAEIFQEPFKQFTNVLGDIRQEFQNYNLLQQKNSKQQQQQMNLSKNIQNYQKQQSMGYDQQPQFQSSNNLTLSIPQNNNEAFNQGPSSPIAPSMFRKKSVCNFNSIIDEQIDLEQSNGLSIKPAMLKHQQSSSFLNYPTLNRNTSLYGQSMFMPSQDGIDIGILYSDPLDPDHIQTDPVNFEKEINKLKHNLQNTQKELTMKIDIATYKKLHQMALQQPKILHFICHGSFSKEQQEYFLHFETEDAKLFKCRKKEIQDIKRLFNNIKLVFVNACHSQEVAKVFHEADIPYVVAVQSNLKIEEEIAQEFSTNFYTSIFSGIEVPVAFETARNMSKNIRGDNCYTCCCAHEHTNNCKWKSILKGDCSEHTPTCDCPKKKDLIHIFSMDKQCSWAQQYIEKIQLYTEDDLDDIMMEQEEVNVCCCKNDDKEIKHDESLKFQLMTKDETGYEAIIFQDKQKGEVEDISNWRVNSNYVWRNLTVDKYKLRKLFDFLKSPEVSVIEVFGNSGIGKTTMCEYTGQYCSERGLFKDGIITINFACFNLNTTEKAQSYLINYFQYPNKEFLFQQLCTHDYLFIFDNCSQVIKADRSEFNIFLGKIVQNNKINVILTTQKGTGKKLELNKFCQIELDQLDEKKGLQLLLNNLPNQQIKQLCQENIYNKKATELVKCMKRYPKNIIQTANGINTTDDLTNTLKKMQEDPFHKMEELYVNQKEGFKLLIIISLFPNGVSLEDLEIMEKLKMIDSTWKYDLMKLINKEDQYTKNINLLVLQDGNYMFLNISEQYIAKGYTTKIFKTDFLANKENEEFKIPGLIDIERNVLKYMAYYCKAIIKSYPKLQFEHSDMSYSILWNFKSQTSQQMQNEVFDMHISNQDPLNMSSEGGFQKLATEFSNKFRETLQQYGKKPYQLYQAIHEKNFYTMLIQDDFKMFLDNLSRQNIKLKIYTEALCQYLPHIFYILKPSQANETCIHTIAILDKINTIYENNGTESTQLQIIKLKFLLLHLYFTQAYPQNFQYRDKQAFEKMCKGLKNIEDHIKNFSKFQSYQFIYEISQIELIFVKAQIIEANSVNRKQGQEKYDLSKAFKNEDTNIDTGIELLNKGIKTIQQKIGQLSLSVDNSNLKQTSNLTVIKAKFYILLAKLLLKSFTGQQKWQQCELIYQEIEKSIKLFQDKNLLYLEIEARLQLVELSLKAFQKIKSVQTIDQIIKIRKKVLQPCQKLCEKHKNPFLLALNTQYKNKINELISNHQQNIFMFMKSNPLVKIEFGKIVDIEETVNRTNSFFKDKVQEILEETNKEIFVKFNVATREQFFQALEKGCTLLILDFLYEIDEEFTLEDDKYPIADSINFTEITQKYLENPSKLSQIQVLLIGAKNGHQYAKFYEDLIKKVNKKRSPDNQLRVPCMITFEFQSKVIESMEKSVRIGTARVTSPIQFVQRTAVQYFYIIMIEGLVNGKVIKEAFDTARESTIQKIVELYSDQVSHATQFEKVIGKGPILFNPEYQKNKEYTIKLNKQGQYINISENSAPTNIKKKYLGQSFTGRSKETYQIMQMLTEKQPVNIYGNQGIGKTDFILQTGYIMSSRKYFSDGIFYFSLKELFDIDDYHLDLKELMQESLGEQFATKTLSFFTDKMCFIFDDFDELYQSSEKIKNFHYIFDPLIKSNAGLVIITQERYDYQIEIEKELLSHNPMGQLKRTSSKGLQLDQNILKKQKTFKEFFVSSSKNKIQTYEFKTLTVSECHLLLDGILNNAFIYVDNKDKQKIIPQIQEYMMVQKDKGNLQKMIDKFVEIAKEELNIDIIINSNYTYKLFGYDTQQQYSESFNEPMLNKPTSNLFLNRKYSSLNLTNPINYSLNQIQTEDTLYQVKVYNEQPKYVKTGILESLRNKNLLKVKEFFQMHKVKVTEDLSSDNKQYNAVHYASCFDFIEGLNFLIQLIEKQYGKQNLPAILEMKTSDGKTPLVVAIISDSQQCIKPLIKINKSTLSMTDSTNMTPFDIAKLYKNNACKNILEQITEDSSVKDNLENIDNNKNNNNNNNQIKRNFPMGTTNKSDPNPFNQLKINEEEDDDYLDFSLPNLQLKHKMKKQQSLVQPVKEDHQGEDIENIKKDNNNNFNDDEDDDFDDIFGIKQADEIPVDINQLQKEQQKYQQLQQDTKEIDQMQLPQFMNSKKSSNDMDAILNLKEEEEIVVNLENSQEDKNKNNKQQDQNLLQNEQKDIMTISDFHNSPFELPNLQHLPSTLSSQGQQVSNQIINQHAFKIKVQEPTETIEKQVNNNSENKGNDFNNDFNELDQILGDFSKKQENQNQQQTQKVKEDEKEDFDDLNEMLEGIQQQQQLKFEKPQQKKENQKQGLDELDEILGGLKQKQEQEVKEKNNKIKEEQEQDDIDDLDEMLGNLKQAQEVEISYEKSPLKPNKKVIEQDQMSDDDNFDNLNLQQLASSIRIEKNTDKLSNSKKIQYTKDLIRQDSDNNNQVQNNLQNFQELDDLIQNKFQNDDLKEQEQQQNLSINQKQKNDKVVNSKDSVQKMLDGLGLNDLNSDQKDIIDSQQLNYAESKEIQLFTQKQNKNINQEDNDEDLDDILGGIAISKEQVINIPDFKDYQNNQQK